MRLLEKATNNSELQSKSALMCLKNMQDIPWWETEQFYIIM